MAGSHGDSRGPLYPSKPKPGFHPITRTARVLGTPGFHPIARTARVLGTPGFHPIARTARVLGTRACWATLRPGRACNTWCFLLTSCNVCC